MANVLVRLVTKVRSEEKSGLGSGTNTVYFLKHEAENKALIFWQLWGSGAPSTDYDTATVGSQYTDYTNIKFYIKKATTGWTEVT